MAAIGSSGVSFTPLQHKSIRDNQSREAGGFLQQLPERPGGPMGRTWLTERFCTAANFLVNDQKELKKQQLWTKQEVRADFLSAHRTQTLRSGTSKRRLWFAGFSSPPHCGHAARAHFLPLVHFLC